MHRFRSFRDGAVPSAYRVKCSLKATLTNPCLEVLPDMLWLDIISESGLGVVLSHNYLLSVERRKQEG